MEVVNQRSALLSNFEVLMLLRELDSDHLAKARTALKIKKEEEAAGPSSTRSHAATQEVIENLRTIEVEAIQYLSADYQPTTSQSEAGITRLTRSLAAYDLTKPEKLQIVNLAPVEPVELYVIVEELEDRFGDKIDEILDTVRTSLSGPVHTNDLTHAAEGLSSSVADQSGPRFLTNVPTTYFEDDMEWEPDADAPEFDDTGEGAGIEGDLDVDDD